MHVTFVIALRPRVSAEPFGLPWGVHQETGTERSRAALHTATLGVRLTGISDEVAGEVQLGFRGPDRSRNRGDRLHPLKSLGQARPLAPEEFFVEPASHRALVPKILNHETHDRVPSTPSTVPAPQGVQAARHRGLVGPGESV